MSRLFTTQPSAEITYAGQRITWQLIERHLKKEGPFRIRGASQQEIPMISRKMGVTSRATKIKSTYDIQTHVCVRPMFLSFTHEINVATRFMHQYFENRSAEQSNVLHIVDTTNMLAENKQYVPDTLGDLQPAEYETIITSFPEEYYIAAAKPSALFGYSLTPNPWYVDPIILNANAELSRFFHKKIRAPYEEMAQDLQKNWISEAQLAAYKADKDQFHTEYKKWRDVFFASPKTQPGTAAKPVNDNQPRLSP